MTLRPILYAQAKRIKKEEAAKAKFLKAEKRKQVNLEDSQSLFF